MTTPGVSVIIVNYNGEALLPACLDSLATQSVGLESMQVIVVDNASRDGSVALLRRAYPWVHVVTAEKNLGFAGGCNLGFRHATAEWVLLLNSDARADDSAVENLLKATRRPDAPSVAAFTARVLLAARFTEHPDGIVRTPSGNFHEDPNGPLDLVNSTGNVLRSDGFGTDRGWLTRADEHAPEADVFGFCGAAALIRRSAFEKVDGFDDRLFMYYEDTDLSWRFRLAGMTVQYCASAVVRHLHAASSTEGSKMFAFYNDRNRLLVVTKNASRRFAVRTVLRYPLTTLSWLRHDWPDLERSRVRISVMASYVRMLPSFLESRHASRREIRVARTTIERHLTCAADAAGASYRY